MQWKEQILDLPPYQPGKSTDAVKREYGLDNIVKLASNENPYGCSKKVVEALQKSVQALEIYPDGHATYLRAAMAKHLRVNENQLIFGNGSDNIIQIISRSLLTPGTNTVMATPSFSQYKHNAVIEGAESREIPLVNGEHDLDNMLKAIDSQTKVVWVCTPNNPSGVYIPGNRLVSFIEQVPENVLVVLDEAYFEYVTADDYINSITLLDKFKNLIVLRTFSKIYGLASLRVGYGVANPEVISALEPVREPFNVNTLAQIAAVSAIEDQEFIEECKQKNQAGLEQFYQFCQEQGLNYFPSQGNFILIDFNLDGNEVFQYLMEHGYIVRSGKALGFPTAVRVTVGSKEQNEGVMAEMKKLLELKSQQVR
ncbi:histidinol-phosphate transaminase [Bacillus marasmi]|uniref:histidinol-phosphate transaminase n=1 Tax=Bacillus marasmi TaxID=1926279 RepID=UPI0011CBCB95|nr:histidinol-phosphate transaminase [Bacillus marasmi]